jgi:pimeloyl-ACP methyl ester carboxylesterase
MTDPLVLIPGLNNTAAVFDRLRARLPADVPAIAVDNPALETVEAIAQALLPALPPRFRLVGFSFGGYVSLALLEAVPERVSGVAMVCTAPNADTPAAAARRAASLQVVAEGRYVEATMAQAANAFHPDSLGDATLMAEREAMVRAYGPERFAAHVRAAIARPDRTALLDGRHPTLVVGGSHDALFTPQVLAYAEHVPGARRVTIEGAGHLVPMERPAELAQCLADWARAA